MNKYIKISALTILSAFALSSCDQEEFLTAENRSDISSDAYFVTEDGFENLAVTPYYKLRNIYGGGPLLFCSGTDLYANGRSNYADVALSSYSTLISTHGSVLSFYKNCYDGIQNANAVIYYGSDAAGENVGLRVAEAKFLKAYYYYLLSQQFGGVPISDTYIASVQNSFPRASLQETYDYIINILTSLVSENVLPASDVNGRANMRAVHNLLAKTYLAAGWDLGTTANADGSNVSITSDSYFKLAAQEADLAIDGKVPSLSFSDMWDVANESNEEIFFAVKYTRGISGQDETSKGNSQDAQFGNYYNDGEATKYTSSQYPASDKLIYLFEPGDERFDGTFMKKIYNRYYDFYTTNSGDVFGYFPAWYEDLSTLGTIPASDATFATAKIYSTSNPSVYVEAVVNGRTGAISYKSGETTYALARTTNGASLCVRKFDDYNAERNGTSAISFHDIVLAHLTETYLIAAEAYHMAGDDVTSLARLNVVRERAKATALTSYASYIRHYSDGTSASYNSGSGIDKVPFETNLDAVDVILDERARELCGEYYRWMDLRRTKRLISYNIQYNPAVTSAEAFVGSDGNYKWYRPIPEDEINLNEGITKDDQNQGY